MEDKKRRKTKEEEMSRHLHSRRRAKRKTVRTRDLFPGSDTEGSEHSERHPHLVQTAQTVISGPPRQEDNGDKETVMVYGRHLFMIGRLEAGLPLKLRVTRSTSLASDDDVATGPAETKHVEVGGGSPYDDVDIATHRRDGGSRKDHGHKSEGQVSWRKTRYRGNNHRRVSVALRRGRIPVPAV